MQKKFKSQKSNTPDFRLLDRNINLLDKNITHLYFPKYTTTLSFGKYCDPKICLLAIVVNVLVHIYKENKKLKQNSNFNYKTNIIKTSFMP